MVFVLTSWLKKKKNYMDCKTLKYEVNIYISVILSVKFTLSTRKLQALWEHFQ